MSLCGIMVEVLKKGLPSMRKLGYNHTIAACMLAAITQALIVNFAPLLFVTFRKSFGLSAYEVTALIGVNFAVQFLTDLLASKFAPKLGVKNCLIAAHVLGAVGLSLMALLPTVLPPFLGLMKNILPQNLRHLPFHHSQNNKMNHFQYIY